MKGAARGLRLATLTLMLIVLTEILFGRQAIGPRGPGPQRILGTVHSN